MTSPEDPRWLLTLIRRTDWVKVAHAGGAFVRAMRGDSEASIAADAERELQRSRKVRQTFEGMARTAIGCRAPSECDCAICAERKEATR